MESVVADFSAQAVVNSILTKAFPNDPIVGTYPLPFDPLPSQSVILLLDIQCSIRLIDIFLGEEDSADLQAPSAASLRAHLTTLANDALRAPLRTGGELGEDVTWGIGPSEPAKSTDELLKLIDRGTATGGSKGR